MTAGGLLSSIMNLCIIPGKCACLCAKSYVCNKWIILDMKLLISCCQVVIKLSSTAWNFVHGFDVRHNPLCTLNIPRKNCVACNEIVSLTSSYLSPSQINKVHKINAPELFKMILTPSCRFEIMVNNNIIIKKYFCVGQLSSNFYKHFNKLLQLFNTDYVVNIFPLWKTIRRPKSDAVLKL